MDQQKTTKLQSGDPVATEMIAERIGSRLKGGEVIELVSDLGGGKTTFTRGLARGFGSSDKVASPTFTVSKVYKAGKREMHHFDFYRLQEGGLVAHELAEATGDPTCVVVVEWGDIVQDVLPAQRLQVRLQRTSDQTRELLFTYPSELSYLLKGLGG